MQTSLELHQRRPDGGLDVLPFHRATVELESGLQFKLQQQQVSFRNLSEEPALQGRPAGQGRAPGAGGPVWSIADIGCACGITHRSPADSEGKYLAPYSGEIWPLGEGEYALGRPGQRENAISLDHPTVSRKHATIAWRSGHYQLLAESATNPVCVGGQRLELGQWVDLSDGDGRYLDRPGLRNAHLHGSRRSTASGSEVDMRTDLYSFGVILYELLSGSPPFTGEDVQEVITQHITQPPAARRHG